MKPKVLTIFFTPENIVYQNTTIKKPNDPFHRHIFLNVLQKDPFDAFFREFCENKNIRGNEMKLFAQNAIKNFDEIRIESDKPFMELKDTHSTSFKIYEKNILRLEDFLNNAKSEVVFVPIETPIETPKQEHKA